MILALLTPCSTSWATGKTITHQIAKIEIYELKIYPMETCKFHKNSSKIYKYINISKKKKKDVHLHDVVFQAIQKGNIS